MIAKKIKTSAVEKRDASNYWQRAQELLESMRSNLLAENWNAAVIDGVHATISANDALTVASLGKRSTSDHHLEAVELLKQAINPNLNPDLNRLRKIINIKSHVEYGPSLVPAAEAKRVAIDVERFVNWAESIYRKIK